MKIVLILTAIIYLLIATHAFAESGHDNNDNRGNAIKEQVVHQDEIKETNDVDKDTFKPTNEPQNITPTCEPSEHWKNHGAFVSCVAHLHNKKNDENNDNDVDESAHSAIGKKHFFVGTPTPTVSLTPTEIPSITVSPAPSETPIPTENISTTPTASVSTTPEMEFDIYKAPHTNFSNNIKTTFGIILTFLAHLL